MIVSLPRSKLNGLLNVFGTEGDERNNVSEIRNLKKRQRRIAILRFRHCSRESPADASGCDKYHCFRELDQPPGRTSQLQN